MLIVLHDSLRELLQPDPQDQMVAALEHLASCCREGKHLLHGELQLLKALARYDPLSKPGRGLYKRLLNDATMAASLLDSFGVRIVVVNKPETHFTLPTEDRALFEVPLQYFKDSTKVQETVLLGENLNDAKFYHYLAHTALRKRTTTTTLHIECDTRGGGGDTTRHEFKHCRDTGRAILCLADGDKKFAKPEPGDTAGKILKEQNAAPALSEVYVLEVRDAENLIPQPIWDTALSQQATKLASIQAFRSKYPQLFPYFDVKKGLLPFEIPVQDPWPQFKRPTREEWFHQNPECHEVDRCPKAKKDDCSCRLIPGLGNKVLQQVLTHLENNRSRPDPFGQHFEGELAAIANKVLAWCVAPMPMRA